VFVGAWNVSESNNAPVLNLLHRRGGDRSCRLASPASAADLNSVARSLNAVPNPGDAQRLEDQARRNQRIEDERYWHSYRMGLEDQRRRESGSQYGDYGERSHPRIGPEEAHRLEQQARRSGRWEDERYWRNYAEGLEGPRHGEGGGPQYREGDRYPSPIGPEQAYALEAQARRNGRWGEAHYWAEYRSGLER
jgi:hypothetical protein